MSQDKLLGRIRKLTDTIQHIRAKFALPKKDQARFDTYGGALSLQKAKEDRRVLQGQLDPIRLIATGVSCRDCLDFAYSTKGVSRPLCWRKGYGEATGDARMAGQSCGPDARYFRPVAAHA